jgi:DNA modification methylase
VTVRVMHGNARALDLPSESVDAVVTSPPYNLGIEYDGVSDRLPWEEYRALARDSCAEMARVLVPGGRAWVNIMRTEPEEPTLGTHRNGQWGAKGGLLVPRVNLAGLWAEALEAAGLNYRDTVAWIQDSHDGACSWGSWRLPSAPNLRGDHEVILLFHKGPWKRETPEGMESWRDDLPGWETICRNVWRIPPAQRTGHPAPFPVELPSRCIRLSTWPGQTVLDPFMGYGTALQAAWNLGRHAIGVDLSKSYVAHVEAKLSAGLSLQEALAL